MAASLTDKITDVRNSARPNSTTVTIARAPAATNLSCNSLAGWPTASKVHFVTYQVDTNNDVIAGTQLDCYGIVSGNTITNMVVLDGTDGGNSVGDKVEMLPTAGWAQDLADGLMMSHNRNGSLANDAVSTSVIQDSAVTTAKINNLAVTNAKLAAGAVTSDKIVGLDKSGLTFDYNPYKFQAYPTSNQTIGANAWTKANYQAEVFDTNSNFDTGTGRYTAPVSGFYQFNMTALFQSQPGTAILIGLGKNWSSGNETFRLMENPNCTGNDTLSGSALMQLTAGDTVCGLLYAASGNTLLSGLTYNRIDGILVSRT